MQTGASLKKGERLEPRSSLSRLHLFRFPSRFGSQLLATPFYAISTRDGHLSIANVPYGRYRLHVWSEGIAPEGKEPVEREITIGENSSSLGMIRVPALNAQSLAHQNKYGRDYDTPTPDNSVYQQQR